MCAAAGAAFVALRGIIGEDRAAELSFLIFFAGWWWWFWRELRLAARVERAGERLCLGCEYDLRELEEAGRCPECGAEFNPAHLSAGWALVVPRWQRRLARRLRLVRP